jgi:hypothetical protein
MSRESRARWSRAANGQARLEIQNPAPVTCPLCTAVVPSPVITTRMTDGCYCYWSPGDPRHKLVFHLRSAIDAAVAGHATVRIQADHPDAANVTIQQGESWHNVGPLEHVEFG